MKGASGLLLVAIGLTLLYVAATGRWNCLKQAVSCLGSKAGGSSAA